MNWIGLIAPAALAALLGTAPLAAQQEQGGGTPPPANEQSGTEEPAAGVDGGRDSSGETAAPERSEDSPFDYRASEEISEDLSVSFPVDI